MRRMFIALVGAVLATTSAVAQLEVQVRVPKEDFLVFESIPVNVSIRNYSGRTIQLEDNGDKTWMSFLVTTEDNSIVQATGVLKSGDPVLIPPGQSISRSIDLLPLYQLRSRGTFWVRANIVNGGLTTSSTPARFTLINGREIWKQTIGLPAEAGNREDYCTYSLVARRDAAEELLYVSVRHEPAQTVYSLVPLGMSLPTGEPQTVIDKDRRLHVLFQNGPRSYGYTEVDPAAKVITRAAFSDFGSRPELVNRDGEVKVMGGEQTYPKPERIIPDDELNPPPPPPKPKKKKKWWWPFGPKDESSDDS